MNMDHAGNAYAFTTYDAATEWSERARVWHVLPVAYASEPGMDPRRPAPLAR